SRTDERPPWAPRCDEIPIMSKGDQPVRRTDERAMPPLRGARATLVLLYLVPAMIVLLPLVGLTMALVPRLAAVFGAVGLGLASTLVVRTLLVAAKQTDAGVKVRNIFRTYVVRTADVRQIEWVTIQPGGKPTSGLCSGIRLSGGELRIVLATLRLRERS